MTKTKKQKGETPSFNLQARTPGQKDYLRKLYGPADIVLCEGPAGTGKTYLATLYATQKLREGIIDKIVITRPNVEAGDPIGLLPGDMDEKMQPWMMPIFDVFHEVYSKQQFKMMRDDGTVEIAPLAFMRGRTFKDSLMIGDEMQNTTPEQMKMFLTRIGEGSRIIATGDRTQHDRGEGASGFTDFINRLLRKESEKIAFHQLTVSDVVRHEVIRDVLNIYD